MFDLQLEVFLWFLVAYSVAWQLKFFRWIKVEWRSRRRRWTHGCRVMKPSACGRFAHPPKPPWVKQELIRLKALMPDAGCRSIADIFNRRFAGSSKVTVGKTFVSGVIRKHHYEIQVLRKNLKHARPKPVAVNLVWGMDMTGKTDSQGALHMLLGIVEHGSRAVLCLQAVRDKSSSALLLHLVATIRRYGKPRFVRTDNESVFCSRLFRCGLLVLGIRHQRTDPGCPWQNGRVERFFGTLKAKLNLWQVGSLAALNCSLGEFRFWYNHVRPHQHLDGCTPAEVWAGVDRLTKEPKGEFWFEAWDGLLQGYYLRR